MAPPEVLSQKPFEAVARQSNYTDYVTNHYFEGIAKFSKPLPKEEDKTVRHSGPQGKVRLVPLPQLTAVLSLVQAPDLKLTLDRSSVQPFGQQTINVAVLRRIVEMHLLYQYL
jgi:hypothetical protein